MINLTGSLFIDITEEYLHLGLSGTPECAESSDFVTIHFQPHADQVGIFRDITIKIPRADAEGLGERLIEWANKPLPEREVIKGDEL